MLTTGCAAPDDGNSTDRNEIARQLQAVEVRPGLWESVSEIVSVRQDGLPQEIAARMTGRRRSGRHCITAEQAAHPDANFVRSADNRDCTYEGFEMRGGRIAGAMVCREAGGGETRARMSGRYDAQSYTMRIEVATPGIGEGRRMNLVTRQIGRRIGDCAGPG